MILRNPNWRKEGVHVWPPGSGNAASAVYMHHIVPLKVLLSISTMKDGQKWVHLSVSYPDRLPSWEELKKVKNEFLGEHVEAIHVLPKAADYVNLHPHCLHLWAPYEHSWAAPNLQNIEWESAP